MGFELDGLIIGDKNIVSSVDITPLNQSEWPEVEDLTKKDLTLNYPGIPASYKIQWSHPEAYIRRITANEIESLLKRTVNEQTWKHITNVWNPDEQKGATFLIIDFKDIVMAPGESYLLSGKILNNLQSDTVEEIKEPAVPKKTADLINVSSGNPDGEKYRQSIQSFAAAIRTNMVFPLLRGGEFIPQISPGKWWDSLYTWDAGFVGLGLQGLGETNLAAAMLGTYLTNPEDPQRPFIHHGTPVPVQIYLYRELWQNSGENEKQRLKKWLPGLVRMHNFLAGHDPYSTTDRFCSGLIQTWDYFYNGGGWDDYPPQVYMHKNNLTGQTAPVAINAHLIRTAKILLQLSECTGQEVNSNSLEEDIKRLSDALQKYRWDDKTGYYGYVLHNKNGEPDKLLRSQSGENFNRGLGGVYPLITGECPSKIETRLISHLENPKELWTDCGWSIVDQSADYYNSNGYWNGAVWYPHAWFFWKRMLDMGQTSPAWKMAEAVLKTWQKEVEQSHRCFEHFRIDTGRGAGWHQFCSLNTPVLLWYRSYFAPGAVTTGFDAIVLETKISADKMEIKVLLTGPVSTLLIVPKTPGSHQILVDEQKIPVTAGPSGVLEIPLKQGAVSRNIIVQVINEQ